MTLPYEKDSPCILSVDLGTSGCKSALVTPCGAVLDWEFQDVALIVLPGGGAEQVPDHWWSAFVSTSRILLQRNADTNVIAICFNTQGESTVPVDAEGNVLMNAVLWLDNRGARNIKRHAGGPVAGYKPLKLMRWLRYTGGAPSLSGKDPGGHMLFIRDEFPDIYEKTYKFLNVLDYMNLRLTGRFFATYDSILTSWVTDNRDPDNIHYHPKLIAQSGIDGDKLPEIVKCTEVIGSLLPEVAAELGLSPETRVVAGAIDVTAAAIGSGAVEDFSAHLCLGTSCWVAAHVPFKKTDLGTAIASVPCAVPSRYLLIALQVTAGGNLAFLRDKILYHKDELLRDEHQPDVFKIMDIMVEGTPPGSKGLMYTPWLFGERAPIEDHEVRASIVGLSLEHSRADMIRAMYEGVALNTRWLLQPVQKFLGRPLDALTIVGGGGNSNVWCQIYADVLGIPTRQPKDPIQANVRGSAFIAAVGLGLITFEEVPKLIEYNNVFQPNPETRSVYDELYATFTSYYKKNRAIFKRLHRLRGE